jgi:hypothetical protein
MLGRDCNCRNMSHTFYLISPIHSICDCYSLHWEKIHHALYIVSFGNCLQSICVAAMWWRLQAFTLKDIGYFHLHRPSRASSFSSCSVSSLCDSGNIRTRDLFLSYLSPLHSASSAHPVSSFQIIPQGTDSQSTSQRSSLLIHLATVALDSRFLA